MPPSGYVTVEVATLASVAKSLLRRFGEEVAAGLHVTREIGIENELTTIARAKATAPPAQLGVLLFTEQLYLALKARQTELEICTDIAQLEKMTFK